MSRYIPLRVLKETVKKIKKTKNRRTSSCYGRLSRLQREIKRREEVNHLVDMEAEELLSMR